MPSQIRKLPKHRSQTVKSLVFTFWLGGNFLLTLQMTFGINRLSVEPVVIMVIVNGFHSWVMEFPRNFLMSLVKLASILVFRSTAMAFRTSCSFQSRTETACSYRSNFKNFELESDVCRLPIGSVHTSANLIFYFSNKNGKRKYYLSLSYLHISK